MRNKPYSDTAALPGRGAGRLVTVAFCVLLALSVARMPAGNAAGAQGLIEIEDEAIPLAESKVLKTTAPGDKTIAGGNATIDVSNANEGYIMVKYSGSNKKVKLQITKSGKKTTYTYNLGGGGKYEAFPLTAGDGKYSIKVFENVSGNQYAQALAGSVDVKLRSATLPFLYPNQYVDFDKDSETVKKSNSLAQGAANQLTIVSNVYNFVIKNISYDTKKAQTVQSGYLPKVDGILKSGKGICFDYAAVMTAMLRAQGIPTRMEIGYVSGGAYHAWLSTYLKDVGWVNSVIYFDGKSWSMMDPTFASGAGAQYVGDGKNYSTQYIY